jgi:hypothetical protein
LMEEFWALRVKVAKSATETKIGTKSLFIQPPERDLEWVPFSRGNRSENKPE